MEGTVADAIEFNLWDDAKIAEKVKSLVKRYGYINVEPVIKSALKPWMSAVKEFMEKITHADKDREGLIFRAFERSVRTGNFVNTPEGYINNVFRPYLDSQGLQDAIVRANGSSTITLEYQGCRLMLEAGSWQPICTVTLPMPFLSFCGRERFVLQLYRFHHHF